MNRFLVLFSIIFFFSNCKKVETPPPSEDTPVFNLQADLNGTTLNLEAGNSDYFLFTDFEKDENDVHTFIGTFAKIDCLDECQDTFRIKIRDFQAVNAQNVDIENALAVGNYEYKNNEPSFQVVTNEITTYELNLDASASIVGMFGTNYAFEYNDTIFSSNDPVFDLNFEDISEAPAEVKLTVSNMQPSCSSTITSPIEIGIDSVFNLCRSYIEVGQVSPAGTELIANGTGNSPFTFEYLWSTEDTEQQIFVPAGSYDVTITRSDGCVSTASISTDSIGVRCQADLLISSFQETVVETDTIFTNENQLSKITIEYADANGNFYSSELENQGSDAIFTILAVEDFENDQNGNPTKKLAVAFECTLFNESGNLPIEVKNGGGTIAVAYPN